MPQKIKTLLCIMIILLFMLLMLGVKGQKKYETVDGKLYTEHQLNIHGCEKKNDNFYVCD